MKPDTLKYACILFLDSIDRPERADSLEQSLALLRQGLEDEDATTPTLGVHVQEVVGVGDKVA